MYEIFFNYEHVVKKRQRKAKKFRPANEDEDSWMKEVRGKLRARRVGKRGVCRCGRNDSGSGSIDVGVNVSKN